MIRTARRRGGFTLFEVVLATALAAVLMGLLGTALTVYLDSVSIGRGDVEQAQLARAVLTRMADDIRAAVLRAEQDLSALSGGGGGGGASAGGSEEAGEFDEFSGSSGSGTSAEGEPIDTAAPQAIPGLYGTQTQLQVDISRIPRFDELDALLQVASPPSGYASDLRTVMYFMQRGEFVDESASAATELARPEPQRLRGGLMRRELDRAAALYSAELGGSQILTEDAKLLAPEVTWIEFQYFDGTQLWQEWNSTDLGGLPVAVEIRLWLRPPLPDTATQSTEPPTPASTLGPGQNDQMYRLIVHLPAAAPLSATGTSATGTSAAGGTGSSGGAGGSAFGSSGGVR